MTENMELSGESEDRQRILLADDEASIRRILETRLKMAGYDVYTAADGEEAVNAFNKYNPDLVVLDVMLMSGCLKDMIKIGFALRIIIWHIIQMYRMEDIYLN